MVSDNWAVATNRVSDSGAHWALNSISSSGLVISFRILVIIDLPFSRYNGIAIPVIHDRCLP